MCRANVNEVSAINWLTLKSDSEYMATFRWKSMHISYASSMSLR